MNVWILGMIQEYYEDAYRDGGSRCSPSFLYRIYCSQLCGTQDAIFLDICQGAPKKVPPVQEKQNLRVVSPTYTTSLNADAPPRPIGLGWARPAAQRTWRMPGQRFRPFVFLGVFFILFLSIGSNRQL